MNAKRRHSLSNSTCSEGAAGPSDVPSLTDLTLAAYAHCPRKAHLQLFPNVPKRPSEFSVITKHPIERTKASYINDLLQKGIEVTPIGADKLHEGASLILDARLCTENLVAECPVLRKTSNPSDLGNHSYEPTIFSAAATVQPEDKLRVLFIGHVLSKIQKSIPSNGSIVLTSGVTKKLRISVGLKVLSQVLNVIEGWIKESSDPPPIMLNKHCPFCDFEHACRSEAEKLDHLTLLRGITPNIFRKFERKGIFSVKQLSYLYKPRKRSKKWGPRPPVHQFELQALSLQTGNIYIKELPQLPRESSEIFLDIEGLPDQNFYYLIGAHLSGPNTSEYVSFWANHPQDERKIWHDFLDWVEQHEKITLFHYGSYESNAISTLGKRYDTPIRESMTSRLVNINKYIFGKVYFPVRSNDLKSICNFLGLSWSSTDASGLKSIVWRYAYQQTGDAQYRDTLLRYNREDCENLRGLTEVLRQIATNVPARPDVRIADDEKVELSETGAKVSAQFAEILKSAHGSYERGKIVLHGRSRNARRQSNKSAGWIPGRKVPTRRITKVIHVRRGRTCPNHKGKKLSPTEIPAEHIVVDLTYTSRGVRKSVIKYIGKKGYCYKCNNNYNPPSIRKFASNQKYGQSLGMWVVYHRLLMRLSYEKISQLMEDTFHEYIGGGVLQEIVSRAADYHNATEANLARELFRSAVIHVDETRVNIRCYYQYVWVFTDGKHVIFRITKNRDTAVVHEMMEGYTGVMVSDFYGGFDSVSCSQQQCWAHLIRDLNDDLRKSPFDTELEKFVSEIGTLISPIFETVRKFGSKVRHLRKYRKQVDDLYCTKIIGMSYHSETCERYRKRMEKYRDKLFVFLEKDGVPWNNNMAERALRHLAIQRKISGSFSEQGIGKYLVLLAVAQTCRFQRKSFLQFLLSGKRNVDQFNSNG